MKERGEGEGNGGKRRRRRRRGKEEGSMKEGGMEKEVRGERRENDEGRGNRKNGKIRTCAFYKG